MFKYGGKNKFTKRFDFFEWSAPYYENQREVFNILNRLNLSGKKLMAINAIGACDGGDRFWFRLYETITNAGVELGENWWKNYPHIDNVQVPWNIELCEPIQFVFDDGATLEILPLELGGARIAMNSVPAGMVDGLNHNNINATAFFQEFIGKELKEVELVIQKNEKQTISKHNFDRKKTYSEFRTEYIIKFVFEDWCKMELVTGTESWYQVRAEGEKSKCSISYKRTQDAITPTNEQVLIVNGRGNGGVIWIVGSNSKSETYSSFPGMDCFGMSVYEDEAHHYLREFLYNYFDSDIQDREFYEEEGFDWYGVNYYTIQSIRDMLTEIYRHMDILKEEQKNPEDSKAIDFYERFCERMEHMVRIPGIDRISFAGP